MNVKELKALLSNYPADMQIRLLPDHRLPTTDATDLKDEHLLLTSETAFVNKGAPEDEWDTEDGKVELGSGPKYLLINPIIH